jgi:hypothetical protein
VVLGWIGWPEEKGFKDVEGMDARFTILVGISIDSYFKNLFVFGLVQSKNCNK